MNKLNLNTLSPIENVNSRVKYDLRYSGKTEKFTVSEHAMEKYDFQNNGLKLFQAEDGTVVMQVVPNSETKLFSGRDGSNKSNTFSSTVLPRLLDVRSTTEWIMESHDMDGETYITLSVIGAQSDNVEQEETEEETITI